MSRLLVISMAAWGCIDTTAGYRCDRDEQCVQAALPGRCEPSAHLCSFHDTTCMSGWIYGTSAGSHAGTCVFAAVPDGATPDAPACTQPLRAVEVATQRTSTLAHGVDGFVWSWGSGNGVPARVPDPLGSGFLHDIVQLSATKDHACAVATDQTILCWGYNGNGRIGSGNTNDARLPTRVVSASGNGFLGAMGTVAAGATFTCARKADDSAVYCWGQNLSGELGNNTTADSSVPVQVLGSMGAGFLSGVSQLAAGGGFNCARRSDAAGVWCWGSGAHGKLGNNSTNGSRTPVMVSGLSDVAQVVTGGDHACARKQADGSVWCWGLNQFGQLGNGMLVDSAVPTQVVGVGGAGVLLGTTALAAGTAHTCAARQDGTLLCWGLNRTGQLGIGTTTGPQICDPMTSAPCSNTPVVVPRSTGLPTVAAAAAAIDTNLSDDENHTCAVGFDNTVFCWGSDTLGEIAGPVSSTPMAEPVEVLGGCP